jgi:hypothetical protein
VLNMLDVQGQRQGFMLTGLIAPGSSLKTTLTTMSLYDGDYQEQEQSKQYRLDAITQLPLLSDLHVGDPCLYGSQFKRFFQTAGLAARLQRLVLEDWAPQGKRRNASVEGVNPVPIEDLHEVFRAMTSLRCLELLNIYDIELLVKNGVMHLPPDKLETLVLGNKFTVANLRRNGFIQARESPSTTFLSSSALLALHAAHPNLRVTMRYPAERHREVREGARIAAAASQWCTLEDVPEWFWAEDGKHPKQRDLFLR